MPEKYLYNGQLMQRSDIEDAAKQSNIDVDSYLKKAGIKVVNDNYSFNGKSIPAEDILSAAKQSKLGFDDYIQKAKITPLPDVKKKDVGFSFEGSGLPFSGQSKSQAQKLSEISSVQSTPEIEKQAALGHEQIEVDPNDPIGSVLKPIRNRVKEIQSTRRDVESTGQNKIQKEQYSKEVENLKDAEFGAVNNTFKDANDAREFLKTSIVNHAGKIPEDNETAKIAQQRVIKNDEINGAINNSNSLEDAALKYYGSQKNTLGEQLQTLNKLGGTNEYNVPDAMRGRLTYQFLNDQDVKEFSKSSPEAHNAYREQLDNLLQTHPEYALQTISSKIAQKMESMGMNYGLLNIVGTNSTDKAVDEMVLKGEMSPQEKLQYDTQVKPLIESGRVRIETPGLLENAGQALADATKALPESVYQLTGRNFITTPQARLYDALDKEYKTQDFKPQGLFHIATSATGQLTGFVLPMGAEAKGLQALSLVKNVGTANRIIAGLNFFGGLKEQAEKDMPDSPKKAYGLALSQAAIFSTVANIFPEFKSAEGLAKSMAPTLKSVINDFTEGNITSAAAKDIVVNDLRTKLVDLADKGGKILSHNARNAIEMSVATAGNHIAKSIFSGKEVDASKMAEDVADTFKTMFLGSTVLSGLAVKGNKDITAGNMLDMASNPKRYEESIKLQSQTDADFAKTADERLNNLGYISGVKEALDEKDLTDKQKGRYLLQSLNQKILEEKAANTKDDVLRKEIEDKIEQSKKVKESILKEPIEEIQSPINQTENEKADATQTEEIKTQGTEPIEEVPPNEQQFKDTTNSKALVNEYGEFTDEAKKVADEWIMNSTSDEIRQRAADISNRRERIFTKYLGEDGYKEYRKLENKVNAGNDIDGKAEDRLKELESKIPKNELPNAYPKPEEYYEPHEWKRIVSALDQTNPDALKDVENEQLFNSFGREITQGSILDRPEDAIVAKGNYNELKRRGFSDEEILSKSILERESQGHNRENLIQLAKENVNKIKSRLSSKELETVVNEENKTTEDTKQTEDTGGEPPKPDKDIEPTEEGEGKNKSFANRIVNAKNTPEAAKEGIKKEGLKYEPKNQQEAEDLAKSIIDEAGLDDAVLQAQAGKFGGDVNTLVQTEALNRLAELSDKETNPAAKLEHDKKFAEIAIQLDESLRKQGRGISAVSHFYKKSPLGIQLMENTKRKQDFENWAKPKEKSWKEAFDEMMKEPEFEEQIKEKVKEGMKEERAAARKNRTKKVDDFIDKVKAQFNGKGGATYATIIPPKVITTALEGIKLAYHAGEHVVKVVQDAIDYISKELGHDKWDKEKFRKEWEDKLKEPEGKKPLTDDELKARILDKFRNKLKGLTGKEKEDVVKKSFDKIIESGGLDYDDFKKIISDITGRGEMTEAEATKLRGLVKKLNSVEDAAKAAREKRTPEALKKLHETQLESVKASKELSLLLDTKPNILKRLTSIMQLNTLGIPSLVNNPIYNIWNQATLRFPIGIINTLIDRAVTGAAKLMGKNYNAETDIFRTQGEFFKKLGLGTKEGFEQFVTGLNRSDYINKEIHGSQIRPLTSAKDLWDFAKGKKKLTGSQIADKALQAQPTGWIAEIIARVLNLGDKPQRYAAEGSQASVFAKHLGLKGIDYDLFIEFPIEEAYRKYKAQGLSDAEAGKKADYVKDTIIREGQRSTFQQDNMLNDILSKVFGGSDSGVGNLVKAVTVSPFIKIPANAYWSYYNLVNPEVALLQSAIYGARAFKNRGKGDNTAAKQLHESRYWFAHAAVGMAMRAVVTSMVTAGIVNSSNDDDETKKEREGEQNYEQQGTVNITKLNAWLRGEDPSKIKGGLNVQNKWFGQWGSVGNTIAKRYENMTPEQKKNDNEYLDEVLGNLNLSSVKELEQGVFANTSSLLTALNKGGNGMQRWSINIANMLTNAAHPAAFAQISRAQIPYITSTKADSFMGELKNSMLQRSSLLRSAVNEYPPAKVGIWGDRLDKTDNVPMRLFGVSKINKDAFARPIYDDVRKTGDIGFFPPPVLPELNGKKLKVDQANKLAEDIGQSRKNYIAPFINDNANIEGFNVKYSQLNNEDKKYVLQYLYELGRADGIEKFIEKYPEFKKEKKEPDYNKDVQKEVFKILSKYNK